MSDIETKPSSGVAVPAPGYASSQYLKHIRRLQREKAVLASMLAEERVLRCRAYNWYRSRLRSRWWWILEAVTMNCFETKTHNDPDQRPNANQLSP